MNASALSQASLLSKLRLGIVAPPEIASGGQIWACVGGAKAASAY
jgi:hypothetical protein